MKHRLFFSALLLCVSSFSFAAFALNEAPNGPGAIGSWSRPDKQGFLATLEQPVTATIAEGILSEVYYPSLDRAQTRDTQLVFVLGDMILEERKHFTPVVKRYPKTLAYHVSSTTPVASIRIEKDIVLDPVQPVVVINYQIFTSVNKPLKVYVLHNPSADNTAGGDAMTLFSDKASTGEMLSFQSDRRGDEPLVFAQRIAQLLVVNHPVEEGATGFEGVNGPWSQLAQFGNLAQKFDVAKNGNVAGAWGFTATSQQTQFTVALSLTREKWGVDPLVTLRQLASKSLTTPIKHLIAAQESQWSQYLAQLNPIGQQQEPHVLMIKGLEDKHIRGALVAGPATPSLPDNVEATEYDYESARLRKGDANGGYRRIWPRDLVQMGLGLMAVGDHSTALDIARYLAHTQKDDGTFWQNIWVDGEPSWQGFQIDQTGFPIILVSKLVAEGAINYDELRSMVVRAADSLVQRGPYTAMDRWEENGGLSPNSIAIATQGLFEAARLEKNKDPKRSQVYEATAQKWKNSIFDWTFVKEGKLGKNYFERIHVGPPYSSNFSGTLFISNNPIGGNAFPENEIMDGGFLQWILSGLFAPLNPGFTSSLAIYDTVTRAPAPGGLGYLRYNHDAYGLGHVGKAWPLLSGERALAAIMRSEDPDSHLDVLFGSVDPNTGVMCEQAGMSVCPLGWSHAEVLIVARSLADHKSYYIVGP